MRISRWGNGILLGALLALVMVPQALAQNNPASYEPIFSLSFEYPDYIPWGNNGQGETAYYIGEFTVYAKTVETPSGNVLQQGYLDGYEQWVGDDTGETWVLEELDNHIFYHYQKDDNGGFLLNEPVWGFYRCLETGQRVKVMWMYHLKTLDEDGTVDEKHVNIRLLYWRYVK